MHEMLCITSGDIQKTIHFDSESKPLGRINLFSRDDLNQKFEAGEVLDEDDLRLKFQSLKARKRDNFMGDFFVPYRF